MVTKMAEKSKAKGQKTSKKAVPVLLRVPDQMHQFIMQAARETAFKERRKVGVRQMYVQALQEWCHSKELS
jgi:hypothetical protein